jgi:hypothetical protein
MVIKRQGGSTILGALGEDEDHKIAGSVLQRLSTNSSDVKKSKTQNAGREMMRQEFDDPAFGVVYEHRDCFGVPKFVGSTDIVAEKQFMLDYKGNKTVHKIVNREQGSTDVVWAGYGSGPVGKAEMDEIRTSIAHNRAERLNIQKLGGTKPYSKHGY